MDLLTRMGGRKFILALIAIGTAMYMEFSGKGLTPTMASFLAGVVAAFHVANYATSSVYLQSRKPSNGDDSIHGKLDNLTDKIEDSFAPAKTDELKNLLISINTGVSQTQELSSQLAKAMVNLNSMVQSVRK